MTYPTTRLRRLRATPALRAMRRETTLAASNLVAPLFVCHGTGVKKPVTSMPGHFQLSVDELVREGEAIARGGIGGVILFGIPAAKDAEGREGPRGLQNGQSTRRVTRGFPLGAYILPSGWQNGIHKWQRMACVWSRR